MSTLREPHLLVDTVRVRLWQRGLARPLRRRDPVPVALFAGSFALYWLIGQLIHEFHGHEVFDRFFNADCPRVVGDMTRAHREPTSGYPNASAHPLFVILTNPVAALVARLLGRSDLLTALLLNHAVAAFAVTLLYWLLRRLDVDRWLATAAALTYAVSATHLVFGGIAETFAFAGAALLGAILVSLSTTDPVKNAVAHVFSVGVNTALGPHALLAAPLLLIGRLGAAQWIRRVLTFWAALAVVLGSLLVLEHSLYRERDFFGKELKNWYDPYTSVPATETDTERRGMLLLPHLVAFNVVAPVPLLTPPPRSITTFMGTNEAPIARYDALGGSVVSVWALLCALATWSNLKTLRRSGGLQRATLVLSAGWLFGSFLLFMVYGDDYFLYSELWTGHVLVWVALGIDGFARRFEPARRVRVGALIAAVFLVLLSTANAAFVYRVLRHYETASLLSL